jgi:hypothetical protein
MKENDKKKNKGKRMSYQEWVKKREIRWCGIRGKEKSKKKRIKKMGH